MRNFKLNLLDNFSYGGEIDYEFYNCNIAEARRIFNLFGDNGLVMLNRDLNSLNRAWNRCADGAKKDGIAAQVRAQVLIIKELMD